MTFTDEQIETVAALRETYQDREGWYPGLHKTVAAIKSLGWPEGDAAEIVRESLMDKCGYCGEKYQRNEHSEEGACDLHVLRFAEHGDE